MTDITINTKNNQTWFHDNYAEDWNVTLVDTGENTMTGGRLKKYQGIWTMKRISALPTETVLVI